MLGLMRSKRVALEVECSWNEENACTLWCDARSQVQQAGQFGGRALAPSAGPTGGAGFALPACNASLIMPVTAAYKHCVRVYAFVSQLYCTRDDDTGADHNVMPPCQMYLSQPCL